MYLNPFLAGVFATILAEIVAFIILVIYLLCNENKKGK